MRKNTKKLSTLGLALDTLSVSGWCKMSHRGDKYGIAALLFLLLTLLSSCGQPTGQNVRLLTIINIFLHTEQPPTRKICIFSLRTAI